jgi:HEPN domain-containing protein
MYCGNYAPWEHYPKNLRHYELQNPLSVIEEFFSCAWPKSHRRDLKEWRDAVINEKFFLNKKHGPGSVLFIHEMNLKLLEALYLLWLDYEENKYRRPAPPEVQLEEEKEKWIYFPNNLSVKELLNPYKVAKKIFKEISPQQFRDYLNDWLHWALSNSAIDETVVPGEVIMVYENMLKLYSAAWLIHQRQSKNGLAKLTKKTSNEVCAIEHPPIELRSIDPTLTAAEQLGLDEVLDTIRTKIPSIQSVTLLDTHNHPFTYYLVVLLDEKEKIAEHEVGNKIEDICRHHISVIAIVHKVNVARQGIEKGKRFWNNIISRGMNIYRLPELQLPEFQMVTEEELIKRASIDWERWGLQGQSFLKGAKYYIENSDFTVAVFLLHQAAESTLIAIIKAVLGYRMSAHNLSRMLRLTLLFTDELKNVFELNTTEGSQMFNLLQTAYSEARYRGSFSADEESVKILVPKVELLLDTAKAVYDQFVEKVN